MRQREKTANNAAFGSGHKYRKYDLPSQKFCLVHLLTRICYLETRRFQWHDDNFDFATLTFAMAAVADEMFHLTIILRQKIVRNIAEVCWMHYLQPDCRLSVY